MVIMGIMFITVIMGHYGHHGLQGNHDHQYPHLPEPINQSIVY